MKNRIRRLRLKAKKAWLGFRIKIDDLRLWWLERKIAVLERQQKLAESREFMEGENE